MALNGALSWSSVPVWLALAWLAVEVVTALGRGRMHPALPRGWATVLLWSLRPWGVWSVFSVVWRLNAASAFDHNLRTFPFFANLWHPHESLAEHLRCLAAQPACGVLFALALLLLAGLVVLAARWGREGEGTGRGCAARLALIYALGMALIVAVTCLPEGIRGHPPGQPGSLTRAWKAHQTVLYAVPFIKSSAHFLRNFAAIQPRLRPTIHGLSHPPGGCLSLYWIGRLTGLPQQADIRSESVRRHYLFGLLAFGLLNVLAVYGLTVSLFGERRIGLLAALLWVTSPTTMAYATFAQDTVYVVGFTLALWLSWCVATAETCPAGKALLLGTVFAALTLMNYSWCLVTAIFAIFSAQIGWRRRWTRRDIVLRALLPLTVMTLLTGAVLLRFRLDYWAIYRVSSDYVRQWYRFHDAYQWLMALIGGQLDLWLMMGSCSLAAFLWAERQAARTGAVPDARRYLWTTLGIFALPLLFGPNPLKMETARCWNWMLVVPTAFAARGLVQHPAARRLVPACVIISGGSYLLQRLFMDFAP